MIGLKVRSIDKTIVIDQSPIGRTLVLMRNIHWSIYSNPSYSLRPNYPEERGYGPGHFSFNVKGGRCEACKGASSMKLEMNFLPMFGLLVIFVRANGTPERR